MIKFILLLLSIIFAFGNILFAQETKDTNDYKNTIRWNLTPIFVVGPKSLVFGYERIIKPHQSFSINIGYLEKSPFKNEKGEPIQFFDQQSKGGFDFSADYRFYMKKENKYKAPHGIYWGPYISYYGIWQDASINIFENSSHVNTVSYKGNFNIYNIGIQIGYQFVIRKKITIDLILVGPSYSQYDLNMNLSFDNPIDTDDPFYQNLYEIIKDSSPALANFLKQEQFEASGRLKFWYYGYRYGLQIGYRF